MCVREVGAMAEPMDTLSPQAIMRDGVVRLCLRPLRIIELVVLLHFAFSEDILQRRAESYPILIKPPWNGRGALLTHNTFPFEHQKHCHRHNG